VACEGRHFLERGVLPDDDFVVGVAVGAHEFLGVFGKHQVADLAAGVDAVEKAAVESVPELDRLVGRPPARGQHSVVVGTPRDALHGRAMAAELADGGRAVRAPDEELVVVASGGQEVAVEGPFEAADLLCVSLIFGHHPIPLPKISHVDAAIAGATGQ
jgi:hypothetical protein